MMLTHSKRIALLLQFIADFDAMVHMHDVHSTHRPMDALDVEERLPLCRETKDKCNLADESFQNLPLFTKVRDSRPSPSSSLSLSHAR